LTRCEKPHPTGGRKKPGAFLVWQIGASCDNRRACGRYDILIRFLIHDDPKQTAVAERLLATEEIWLAKTVILETSWVLRSYYGFDREAIHRSFLSLFGIDNVHVEDEADVVAALALAAQGIDLADALHLMSRPPDSAFVSFDQKMVRRAHRAGIPRVSTLPYIM